MVGANDVAAAATASDVDVDANGKAVASVACGVAAAAARVGPAPLGGYDPPAAPTIRAPQRSR